jgi:hypothetical protein
LKFGQRAREKAFKTKGQLAVKRGDSVVWAPARLASCELLARCGILVIEFD